MKGKSDFLFLIIFFLGITTLILFFTGPELVQQRLSILHPIPQRHSIIDSVIQAKESQGNEKISLNGQIGDSFGGTMSPVIAWIAAILTFAAFYVQYKANEQQKIDLRIERFEGKFYKMLEILRQNITETKIGKSLQGRKAFISMFYELKFLYLFTEDFFKKQDQKALIEKLTGRDSLSKEDTYNIVYLIFFFGIGQSSTKLILDLVDSRYEGLILNLEAKLKWEQIRWKKNMPLFVYEEDTHEGISRFFLETTYKPFNGHMSRLSHYVRHLYQLVKFIDEQPDDLIDYEGKYNYAATVRAQLSIHEQLLLYYNALSVLGKPWFQSNNNFIKKYCMIKSLPIPLANFYKYPFDVLPKVNEFGKTIFEWTEVHKRMNSSNV